MPTQAERRSATRARIMSAFREHVLDHGYAATSLRDIERSAGVSRGSIYHHFSSKDAVFEAIFDEETRGAIERAVRRIDPDADSREGFVAGCLAWLDEVAEPTTAEIALALGPEVLGWRRFRETESAHSLAFIRIGLDRMVDAGRAEIDSVSATARLLNAVLAEMAWSCHSGELQPAECRDAARRAIDALLGPD